MKLFAILFAAILALCTTIYLPTETPPVKVDIPIEAPQQEQDNTPTVIGETPLDVVAASPQPQESNMAPTTDTESASAETAVTIVEVMAAEEKVELPVEVVPVVVEPVPTIEEPVIVESAKVDIPSVVEHAKTDGPDDVPVVVEHAKTGYAGKEITTPAEPPVIEPEQPSEPADIDAAIAAAEAFAIETYNTTIDPTLDFTNSAYRFPAAAPLDASQEFLNNKAIGIVDYTFQQQIRQFGVTIEKMRETGIRCRIYVEQTENDLLVYCLYA